MFVILVILSVKVAFYTVFVKFFTHSKGKRPGRDKDKAEIGLEAELYYYTRGDGHDACYL